MDLKINTRIQFCFPDQNSEYVSGSEKFAIVRDFQSLLFSPIQDQQSIKSKIEELQKELSQDEIDHHLILALSFYFS